MGYIWLIEPLYKIGLLNDKMQIQDTGAIFEIYSKLSIQIKKFVKLKESRKDIVERLKIVKNEIESLNKTKTFFKTIPHEEMILFAPKTTNSKVYDARKDDSKFYKEAIRLLKLNEYIVADKIASIVKKIKKPGSFMTRRENIESIKAAEMIDELFSERIETLKDEIGKEKKNMELISDDKKVLAATIPDFRPNIPLIEYILNRFSKLGNASNKKNAIIKTNFDISTWMEAILISSETYIDILFNDLYADTNELANLCC